MKKTNIILIILLIATIMFNSFPLQTLADPAKQETESFNIDDSDNSNLRINLFDYSTGTTESVNPSNNYNAGINKGHEFKFLSDAGNLSEGHMNKWTGSHGYPRTGIVETKLVNGYPKVVNGESLAYLFNDSKQTGKTAYMDVDGLFQVDENGYTYFNSNDNYAEYNSKTNSFDLKDVILRKGKPFPCFYPFDSYNSSYQKAQKDNGVDASLHSFTVNNANHYFGMTFETEFYILEDGKIHGEDMVFNFSGDDDVWVFIDDTLALDIGGIHTTVSGSINFNTGDVIIANDEGTKKSQENIYKNGKIDNADYSKHTLKVFYLERGNSASNCNISFNLPTIPEEAVALTKKVVDESGKLMDEALMIDFRFLIKKNDQPLANSEFTVYTETGTENRFTDENGYFYLKNGYTVIFTDYTIADTFEITEIDYALNGYNVTVNGHEIVVSNKSNSVTNIIPSATTGTMYVKDTQNILFKNIVDKVTDLYITKEIEEENYNIVHYDYDIKLELNGKPYVGNYIMDGKTYQTNDEGIFTLRNEETIKIESLPYGTSFKISEIKSEDYTQDYTFSSNVYDATLHDNTEDTAIYGRIGGASEVVSINEEVFDASKYTSVDVVVEWVNDTEKVRPDEITFDLYKNGILYASDITINKSNNWSYTFDMLPIYDGEIKNIYSAVETKIGNESVKDNIALGYFAETFDGDEVVVIRNTYGGDLIIKKTIDDKIDENPVFIFKITDRFGDVRYEFIKFNKNETSKLITVSNIPLGNCTVEELDVLRYQAVGSSTVQVEVKRETQMVEFYNKLVYVPNYTDIDHTKNHFVIGEKMEAIT